MWRLIFLGLIIWLVIYFFKRHISQIGNQKSNTEQPETNGHVENGREIENMVQCATCAVHLPRSEAFLVADKFYCCTAHIQKK
jgi:uncharacterized protein